MSSTRFVRSRRALTPILALAIVATTPSASRSATPHREVAIDARSFRVVTRESGPVNYYSLVHGAEPHWHAAYRPPMATTVLGYSIPERDRRSVSRLRWKWRAVVLPNGGDECTEGKGDSAAVVYVTFKRALRWYTLKYVWSAVGRKGSTCDRKRNPFVAQDTIIAESGPPLNEWRTVEIDPDQEFRKHFEDGDPKAAVPDLVGIGIMTDGDQTSSPSEADYGSFFMQLR